MYWHPHCVLISLMTSIFSFDTNSWVEKYQRVLKGNMTFLEAFLLTGRVLNISVTSETGDSNPSQMLNYVTAPDCVVWSAGKFTSHFVKTNALLPNTSHGVMLSSRSHSSSHAVCQEGGRVLGAVQSLRSSVARWKLSNGRSLHTFASICDAHYSRTGCSNKSTSTYCEFYDEYENRCLIPRFD
jgi:hypothetical protein